MRHLHSLLLPALLSSLVACSGSSGSTVTSSDDSPTASAVFEPGTGEVTPDSIYGTWGGVIEDNAWTFDTRLRLTATTATIATRCQAPNGKQGALVGVTVKARVDEEAIAYLESKNDERTLGDITCRANARPMTIERCATREEGFEQSCFVLDGTTLTVYGRSPLEKATLTKLAD